ncbi:MAG: tRNA guanosine(34) transglycosylase Tgt [Cytophagales bacterium]|nr:tRNA guanosine(34) transglycosylase Tgt [Cytophagales bacterium]
MKFNLISKDKNSKARAGEMITDHGRVITPAFMPVGTSGSVKAVHQRELEHDIKAEIILSNTYHLYLKPGIDIIKKAGGIHKFIGWNKPVLTDSGGYQVYSLSKIRKINEEGVTFQSHIDGSKHTFTPENVVDIQRSIGADIIMAFDECTPFPCDHVYAKRSMEMTHRWLKRCCERVEDTPCPFNYSQTLLPIVQGSVYKDLRKISAKTIASFNCEGNAIGGLSVGEPSETMYEMTEVVCNILPEDKPRYLMGVGKPENILECIALGVDMFDCVIPTRNARNGWLYTSEGIINIRNKKWKNNFQPVDEALDDSYVSQSYSKAYLRHLIDSNEILGAQIASIHNLSFYTWLVNEARQRIISGDFYEWKNEMVKKLNRRL